MRTAKLTAAFAVCAGLLATLGPGAASAEFGISAFGAPFQDPSGSAVTQAGSHADAVTDISFNMTTNPQGETIPDEEVRDLIVDLPAGLYGNPQAAQTCNAAELVAGDGYCKPAAQVGVLEYEIVPDFSVDFPVYNMVTPPSQTAVLAAVVASAQVKFDISARTDGDYGLTATVSNVNQALILKHTKLTLWGVPADPAHDEDRCIAFFTCGYPAGVPPKPFLSIPARCGPMTTNLEADSWQHPGVFKTATYQSPPLEGCDQLQFAPTLRARPTTNAADSPSGLEVDLQIPQNEDPGGLSVPHLRKAEVTLPEGLVLNPSGANGLAACSPAQIGLTSSVGSGSPSFNKAPNACPSASRIGSVEVDTPVFPDPLKGAVFAATPTDNPFGNLLTIYVVVEGRGLVIKLAGKVTPDPRTGRLTATFDENPQLTFEDFKLSFFGGALGVLRTPATCGSYATTSAMTPWSAPESGPPATPSDSYAIERGANGQGCATSEAQLPHKPDFEGGSSAPTAGQYKPFIVNLKREDGAQQFSAVTLTPPPGLLAKLAGTETCSDAALAAAASKSGNAEKASPSCPASSEVGNVHAAAGAGPKPFNAPGTVYLTGPYKGAPLSLATVIPATAGPYDLGTVVTRVAVAVDPESAQVTATSDPIPQILKGIPLDVRAISLRLDRPNFTLNPTSCDPSSVSGILLSTTGAGAALDNRFQLGGCRRLEFKPSLSLSLKGATKRSGYPALTAILRPRAGDANIAAAAVALPHSEFLAQEHIKTVCTRVQFAAEQCPRGSIYGFATARTPLLEKPLSGPVYLRSSSNPLPDLVAALHGQIDIDLVGRIDSRNGGIRTTFDAVPDAPVSKFVLKMRGGRKGLLQNSRDLCRSMNRAAVWFAGQNGKARTIRPALKAACKKRPGHSQKRGSA